MGRQERNVVVSNFWIPFLALAPFSFVFILLSPYNNYPSNQPEAVFNGLTLMAYHFLSAKFTYYPNLFRSKWRLW